MQQLCSLINVIKPAARLIPFAVDLTDPRLKSSYEDNFNELRALSDERRRVHALIEVHDLAQVLGGPDSSGVHETMWHLLLPQLRPALRQWYLHSASERKATTDLLRKYLSNFLGEGLGISQIDY